MRAALRYLGALWVLPIALPIWLFYLLPAWALGWVRPVASPGPLVMEFRVVGGVGPRWWKRRWAGWAGHAMPFAIVVNVDSLYGLWRVRAHELRHTDQWLVLGPLFLPVYGVLLLLYGYAAHPLELDAEFAAEQALRATRPVR